MAYKVDLLLVRPQKFVLLKAGFLLTLLIEPLVHNPFSYHGGLAFCTRSYEERERGI